MVEIRMDRRALAFTLGLTLVTTLARCVPALAPQAPASSETLKGARASPAPPARFRALVR